MCTLTIFRNVHEIEFLQLLTWPSRRGRPGFLSFYNFGWQKYFFKVERIRGRTLKPVGGVKTCCKVVTLPRLAGVEVPGEVVPLTSLPGGGGTFSDGVLGKKHLNFNV